MEELLTSSACSLQIHIYTELHNAQATDTVTLQLMVRFPREADVLFFVHILGPFHPSSIHAKDAGSKMAGT
jgi:hypothetical protein